MEEKGIFALSSAERRDIFDKTNRLRQEHPIMQEVLLTTMCKCYIAEKDKDAKFEFLKELCRIRKNGKTNQEKNEMADTFAHILEKEPDLKADNYLVRLSQRDTVVSQPAKQVRRQIESGGK